MKSTSKKDSELVVVLRIPTTTYVNINRILPNLEECHLMNINTNGDFVAIAYFSYQSNICNENFTFFGSSVFKNISQNFVFSTI